MITEEEVLVVLSQNIDYIKYCKRYGKDLYVNRNSKGELYVSVLLLSCESKKIPIEQLDTVLLLLD